MTRFKNHITFFVLGIFIFPILFQAIHIVWHTTPDDVIINESSCCTSVEQESQRDSVNLTQETDLCLICEYEFTINSLPETDIFQASVPVLTGAFKIIITEEPNQQIFSLKSPRAPPFLS